MTTMTDTQKRHLPTGTWIRIGDDAWRKACRRCHGENGIDQYRHVEHGVCYLCGGYGFASSEKVLTTEALDRKEAADIKRAAQEEAKRAEEAALHAKEWAAQEAANLAAEVAEAHAAALIENARRDGSRHLDAAEGDKVRVSGTVVLAHTYEAVSYSGWGTDIKRIVAVDLGDGVTVKMFTAAGWAFTVAVGDTVTIAGTVKSHGDYNGVKETTLNRPRLIEHVEAA